MSEEVLWSSVKCVFVGEDGIGKSSLQKTLKTGTLSVKKSRQNFKKIFIRPVNGRFPAFPRKCFVLQYLTG